MLPNRDESLDALCDAIAAHDWDRCVEQSFRLLFTLPADAGRDIARETVARYAATFRRGTRELTWPDEILSDPVAWSREHGRATGETPPHLGVADDNWLVCLDALLLAVAEDTDLVVRTAACATATVTALNSRALAVWEVDDPEAVRLWRAGLLPPWRTYQSNASARAVLEREWWWTARRLAEAVGRTPAPHLDPEEVEAGVERWRNHEYRLILPA